MGPEKRANDPALATSRSLRDLQHFPRGKKPLNGTDSINPELPRVGHGGPGVHVVSPASHPTSVPFLKWSVPLAMNPVWDERILLFPVMPG